MGSLYTRLQQKAQDKPVGTPQPTEQPVATSLYERVASRIVKKSEQATQSSPFAINIPAPYKTSTPSYIGDIEKPATLEKGIVGGVGAIGSLGKVVGQGIARGWSAAGGRLAQTIGTADTDVIDPNTFFGTSETGKKAAVAFFGTDQPFNATSEDVAFLESFGVDPEIAKGTGGSLTMLLTALDLTGAGGAVKGLRNATKAVRAVKTTEEAFKLGKSLGLSDDIARQFEESFVNAQTVQEAKKVLEDAAKAQSATSDITAQADKMKAEGDSVQSFIEKQPTKLFHRTNVEFDEFDIDKSYDGLGTWFFTKSELGDEYATNFPIMMERYLDRKLKTITEKQLDKLTNSKKFIDSDISVRDMLLREGYEAVDYGDGVIQVLDPKILKTRAQLEEIWNKTDSKPSIAPKAPVETKNKLLSVHNLSEQKLRFADRVGGLANPSLAVIDPKLTGFESYGDISLIGDKNLIEGQKTHLADAYSPRFPSVHSTMAYKDYENLTKEIEPYYEKIGKDARRFQHDDVNMISNIENNPAVALKFLEENGIKPTKEGQHYYHSQIRNSGLENKYQIFLDDLYKKYNLKEQMFAGYTNTGKRRYKPVSVEEASKIMSKQKEEGFNYGLGSYRSKIAPIKRTATAIRKEAGRLVTKEQFELVKEAYDKELWDLKDKLQPYAKITDSNSFIESDNQLNAIGSVLSGGKDAMYYFRNKYPGIPQNLISEVFAFRDKLKNMPTEYFETKFQRPVDIGEFKIAVVPDSITPEARAILEKKGLRIVTYAKGQKQEVMKSMLKQQEAFGMLGGVSQDEEGNFEFNPLGAALGVAGMRAMRNMPTNAQIDELSKRVKDLAKVPKKDIKDTIGLLEIEASFIEDSIKALPGSKLAKYVSKTTGELPEITGKPDMLSLTGSGKKVKNSLFGQKGDEILDEIYGGNVPDRNKIQDDLDTYRSARERLDAINRDIAQNKRDIATIRKGERITRVGMQVRKMRYRAVAERYTLTDAELAKFRRGRDVTAMEQSEFDEFIAQANKYGEETEKRSEAMMMLKAVIDQKDLKKWENVVQAMNLPPIHQMNTEQLVNLEKILDQFKYGDEFLPVRMLQTIDNTKLKGVKTVREVLEVLAKEKNLTPEDVAKFKPTEFHRFMDDPRLARQHPFYERLVEIKNEAFVKANARIFELTEEIDNLVSVARKSKPQGVEQRAIPTDDPIVDWLESDVPTRTNLEKTMTAEEVKAAKRMDDIYREYYDYLVKKNADKKFSRFEDQYFPHVRRGFLEAWKEDGVLKAFKEIKDQFAQDQKYMNILNEQTGEILPYEKWVGFKQYRSDLLVPTKNAARAFEAYVTALERARHLDEMTPEIMAYVHALSPRKLSEHGIEIDNSLKRFVKEYVNANKGRHPKGFFEPGGKLDWVLRSSVAFTRIIDLGFNFTTQLVAPIGEQTMTLTMLKPQAYSNALVRRNTQAGKEILQKYRAFTGRTLFGDVQRATADIGDKFLSGMFGMYHTSARNANELFLLGKMTDEEFASKTITPERLAKLQLEMGKYRKVKGLESIMERTSEMGAALQYKSWALPIAQATITNLKDLAKITRRDGLAKALSSDAGKELFYSVGIGVVIGGVFYQQYQELKAEKDRSFMEDLTFKAMRDSLSLFGAFDPTMWANVRTVAFFEDISEMLLDAVTLDEYKTTGELKAPKQFANLVTPSVIKQFQREFLEEEKEEKPKRKTVPTPKGLPELPSAQRKLPTPPGLPSLP